MNRRSTLARLLTGLLAAATLWGIRRGIPGAGRLAARMQPEPAAAPTFGFKEVDLS